MTHKDDTDQPTSPSLLSRDDYVSYLKGAFSASESMSNMMKPLRDSLAAQNIAVTAMRERFAKLFAYSQPTFRLFIDEQIAEMKKLEEERKQQWSKMWSRYE